MANLRNGSEYGGMAGPIQPPPHEPSSAAEQAMLVYATDPANAASTPETAYAAFQKLVKE